MAIRTRYVNHFRLRGYLPVNCDGTTTYLPSQITDDAIRHLTEDSARRYESRPERWALSTRFRIEENFALRADSGFRNVLESLTQLGAKSGEDAYAEYYRYIESTWMPALEDGMRTYARHCI